MTNKEASLCAAVREGDVSTVRTFLEELPSTAPWPRDEQGHTPLHWASMLESSTLLLQVLSCVNANRPIDVRSSADAQAGQTPLHWACVSGRVQSVQLLLERGADPAALDEKGYSAATHVVHYGRVDLLHIILQKSPALVSVADEEGHTLLQWAAYYDHTPVVAYLLAVRGVDPDAGDQTGMTALHRAAQRDRFGVAETLLRNSADTSCKNASGKTPADLACAGSRTAHLLGLWGKGILTTRQPVPSRHALPKYGLVLFYYSLVIASYLKYYSELIRGDMFGLGWNIVFHISLLVSVASHVRATFADPGDIPKGTAEDLLLFIEDVLARGTSEVALVPSAYCYTCLSPRPPRSKHSRERDRCVKLFDHECPWVNNTVGLYTHKALLLLVFSTAIVEWLFIDAMILGLIANPAVSSLLEAFSEKPLTCLLVLIHAMVSVFCVMLFATHIRLVLRGRTTYEHLVAVRDKITTNPYDFGMWKNFTSFLTSTGPGTGRLPLPISASTLQEIVLSNGEGAKSKSVFSSNAYSQRKTTGSPESERLVVK